MLRRATPDDLPILTALARREDVARTLATDTPDTLGEALSDAGGELRGKGLATAAIRELAERLFLECRLHRIEAEVYGFNLGGRRVFERAGCVNEGVRRRDYDREDGWQDGGRYGLLSDEL